jgi:hypothetical protein
LKTLLYKETFLPPPEEILVYSLKLFCTNIVRTKKKGIKERNITFTDIHNA